MESGLYPCICLNISLMLRILMPLENNVVSGQEAYIDETGCASCLVCNVEAVVPDGAHLHLKCVLTIKENFRQYSIQGSFLKYNLPLEITYQAWRSAFMGNIEGISIS
jgi:hypothetical protein